MNRILRSTLALAVASMSVAAHGQFYKLKGASVSAGGTGLFSTSLESSPTNANYSATRTGGGGVLSETASGQQQFTTDSAGGLVSLNFHPVAWAGVEVNYGFNHYSEVFGYTASSGPTAVSQHVNTYSHEATAAYVFHPKHIKFQPFVNIGGGAISFMPPSADSQWRWAGLLETGFDIPTKNPHLAFRMEGRSLYYRAPNFYNSTISTKTWRVTEEPAASVVFRF